MSTFTNTINNNHRIASVSITSQVTRQQSTNMPDALARQPSVSDLPVSILTLNRKESTSMYPAPQLTRQSSSASDLPVSILTLNRKESTSMSPAPPLTRLDSQSVPILNRQESVCMGFDDEEEEDDDVDAMICD